MMVVVLMLMWFRLWLIVVWVCVVCVSVLRLWVCGLV